MKKIFLIFLFLILVISLACYFRLSKKFFNNHNAIEKTNKSIEKANNISKEENLTENISIPTNTNNYKQSETITLDEYLYADKKDKVLKLNKNGDVIFNNKVIITKRNTPINDDTAYTDDELKTLFHAKGIKPDPGCDPKDTAKNGTLGCYLAVPEE